MSTTDFAQMSHVTQGVERRYTFTNGTGNTINFKWNGRDHLPAPASDIYIEAPGIVIGTTGGAAPVLEWDLPSPALEPEGVVSVCITLTCSNLAQLNPLRLNLGYQSAWLCSYSFDVHSPFGGLIHRNDCALTGTSTGASLALILGHDGVLRTDHPARVSAGVGPCSLTINKALSPGPNIPLLQYYSGRGVSEPKPLEGHVVLLIPHLLSDAVPYVESLCAAGLQPDGTFIIGIPYSAKREIAGALWQRGFRNIELPTDYPFMDTVRQVLQRALQFCRELEQPLLIVEDGGYAGPLLHTKFISDLSRCCGIVEQTRNGIWNIVSRRWSRKCRFSMLQRAT